MLTLSLSFTILKIFLGLGTTSFSSDAYSLAETMTESKLAQIWKEEHFQAKPAN